MAPKYIKAPVWLIRAVGAAAITVYPFVLILPGVDGPALARLKTHELVHWNDQRRWCVYGLGVGLLLWFALYLLALPVWWNPLRRGTETRALKTEGYSEGEIRYILRHRPYYLL